MTFNQQSKLALNWHAFRMNAEISIGEIPIPTVTDDPIMKEGFQLKSKDITCVKPNQANIEAEKVDTKSEKLEVQTKMKQVQNGF